MLHRHISAPKVLQSAFEHEHVDERCYRPIDMAAYSMPVKLGSQ